MNKKNLFKNHDSSINISALRASMIGKRVLVVDDELPNHSYEVLRRFFDVSIAVGLSAGEYCGNPDILISTRLDPHKDGVLDLSMYDRFGDTIICVPQQELNLLKNLGQYHSSYVLSWLPMDIPVSDRATESAAITYGLSAKDPGVHLATIAGSTNIYSKSIHKELFQSTIDVLISERSGYVPRNILRPTRPQFIQEVKLAD